MNFVCVFFGIRPSLSITDCIYSDLGGTLFGFQVFSGLGGGMAMDFPQHLLFLWCYLFGQYLMLWRLVPAYATTKYSM